MANKERRALIRASVVVEPIGNTSTHFESALTTTRNISPLTDITLAQCLHPDLFPGGPHAKSLGLELCGGGIITLFPHNRQPCIVDNLFCLILKCLNLSPISFLGQLCFCNITQSFTESQATSAAVSRHCKSSISRMSLSGAGSSITSGNRHLLSASTWPRCFPGQCINL